MEKLNLTVEGMHCRSCKLVVEDVLHELGAANIKILIDEKRKIGMVSCECADKGKVIFISAIEQEGYKVKQ